MSFHKMLHQRLLNQNFPRYFYEGLLCLQEYVVNNHVIVHWYLNLLTLSSEKYDLFVETFSVREYVVNTDAVYPELFADICPLCPQCWCHHCQCWYTLLSHLLWTRWCWWWEQQLILTAVFSFQTSLLQEYSVGTGREGGGEEGGSCRGGERKRRGELPSEEHSQKATKLWLVTWPHTS